MIALSNELLSAWEHGVCDGMEIVASMAGGIRGQLAEGSETWAMFDGLIAAVRVSQARMQFKEEHD